jgi:hypothetical protein
MHVLTRTESARLTISIARHLSDSMNRVILHAGRDEWSAAVLHAAPGLADVPDAAARFSEPAIEIQRTREGRATVLTAPSCAFRFQPLAGDAILCRFQGEDTGSLTDLALDEMEQWIEKSRAPLRWFLDLRDARTVSPEVSRVCTQWIGVRRDCFARISALSFDPLFPLVLTMARLRSGADFRVHRELEPFRQELAAASSAAAAGL